MRQIVYVSSATTQYGPADLPEILSVSRTNNARDAITGLLYFDGKRFLQALEGDEQAIARTIARIDRDPRHRALVILSDRTIAAPEFGDWSMAHWRAGTEADVFLAQVSGLVANASPNVRATFESFVALRRAA